MSKPRPSTWQVATSFRSRKQRPRPAGGRPAARSGSQKPISPPSEAWEAQSDPLSALAHAITCQCLGGAAAFQVAQEVTDRDEASIAQTKNEWLQVITRLRTSQRLPGRRATGPQLNKPESGAPGSEAEAGGADQRAATSRHPAAAA